MKKQKHEIIVHGAGDYEIKFNPALKPSCPACKSQDVRFRALKKSFICRRCGHEWEKKEVNKK